MRSISIMTLIAIITLVSCTDSKPQQYIKVEPVASENKVDVYFSGKLFTSYIYPGNIEKPVLYPIYAADGNIVTRGFPLDPRPGERVDHPHHSGLWFNYGDVNGLDFWNNSYAIPKDEKFKYGSIRHKEVVKAESGEGKGLLVIRAEWIDSENNPLLDEETSFIFSGDENLRRIDRITKLTAREQAVHLGDNKEGLLGIRVDRAFEAPSDKPEIFTDAQGNPTSVPVLDNSVSKGVYRSSTGLEKDSVWGSRADWVSLTSVKNNDSITIAIVDNMDNIGYPAHWHARGYGLFAINNLGANVFDADEPIADYTIEPGNSITFRHRILIKSGGGLTDKEMNQEFESFNEDY